MTESAKRGRGRRATPPPRDILAGKVRDDELPDVVRPVAPGPAAPAAGPGSGDPMGELMRAVAGAAWLPFRIGEAVLVGQADAIAQQVDSGAVPPALVPGAVMVEMQLRVTAGLFRAVPGVAAAY